MKIVNQCVIKFENNIQDHSKVLKALLRFIFKFYFYDHFDFLNNHFLNVKGHIYFHFERLVFKTYLIKRKEYW